MRTDCDIAVVGGGAAGLSAAQYGALANLRTLVIEQTASGGQCLLISDLENYPGIPDSVNGYEFTERLERQARQFGAEFLNATVTRLDKAGSDFILETTNGEVKAGAVILATGAQQRHLHVPGEEELTGRGVSYCATCDGPFFRDRPVLVVGGGDSACDEASFLSRLTQQVTVVHRRAKFRAQPALAQRVLADPNISVRFSTVVTEILSSRNPMGFDQVSGATVRNVETNEVEAVSADAVFIFVGSDPRTDLVPTIPKDDAGRVVTDQLMQTAVPGLFAVGDVRATPFRQLVVAAGEGAVAANAAAGYIATVHGSVYHGHLA